MESVPDIPVDSSGHVLSSVCLCVRDRERCRHSYCLLSWPVSRGCCCRNHWYYDAVTNRTSRSETVVSYSYPLLPGLNQLSHTLIIYYQVWTSCLILLSFISSTASVTRRVTSHWLRCGPASVLCSRCIYVDLHTKCNMATVWRPTRHIVGRSGDDFTGQMTQPTV